MKWNSNDIIIFGCNAKGKWKPPCAHTNQPCRLVLRCFHSERTYAHAHWNRKQMAQNEIWMTDNRHKVLSSTILWAPITMQVKVTKYIFIFNDDSVPTEHWTLNKLCDLFPCPQIFDTIFRWNHSSFHQNIEKISKIND